MSDSSFTPRSVPETVAPAFRDGLFQAVREAWVAGAKAREPQYPPLERQLRILARAARERDLPVADVLRTLDAVCRPPAGGDASLDWDSVRDWAGRVAIAAHYRSD
jgi:hypothetical protein